MILSERAAVASTSRKAQKVGGAVKSCDSVAVQCPNDLIIVGRNNENEYRGIRFQNLPQY